MSANLRHVFQVERVGQYLNQENQEEAVRESVPARVPVQTVTYRFLARAAIGAELIEKGGSALSVSDANQNKDFWQ